MIRMKKNITKSHNEKEKKGLHKIQEKPTITRELYLALGVTRLTSLDTSSTQPPLMSLRNLQVPFIKQNM